ncbi:hypothetical protein PSAC2689_40249 [Paraburkholderia sacchari]
MERRLQKYSDYYGQGVIVLQKGTTRHNQAQTDKNGDKRRVFDAQAAAPNSHMRSNAPRAFARRPIR